MYIIYFIARIAVESGWIEYYDDTVGDKHSSMIKVLKILAYLFGPTVCTILLIFIVVWISFRSSYYLPSQERILKDFDAHKADYTHFVELLQREPHAREVDDDGVIIDGTNRRSVPEFRDLIHKIGAKFVNIGEDGSFEFALWGNGCALCSDSYMGVLYVPKGPQALHTEWRTEVASLASSRLPQEKGAVASGLYVVGIEPQWFIYRFEYQE